MSGFLSSLNRRVGGTALALTAGGYLVACSGGASNGTTTAAGAPGAEIESETPGMSGVGGNGGTIDPEMGPPSGGRFVSAPGPASQLFRLSHVQWENTVRDLLRLPEPTGLSAQFLEEPLRSMFDNSGGVLEVTSQLWLQYRRAADELAKQVAHDPDRLAALVPPSAPADLEGRARALISDLGRRAYRRPLVEAEIEQYLGIFRQAPTLGAPGGDPFAEGIELVLAVLLQSPNFIYRVEVGGEPVNGMVPLSGYEVAARLSYGLTRSMPDDTLFSAAEAGLLQTVEGVRAEAARLLDSAAGKLTLEDLHHQVLREVDPSALMKDIELNPTFEPGMGLDMKQERDLFIGEVIATGGGLKQLLTAPYTFVNSRLAPFYGVTIDPGAGDAFVKVDLDPSQRAGLFTQLGFLAETGTDVAPRPIKRGVFLSRQVLCREIPPPPPNVEASAPPPDDAKTNRQAHEQVTSVAPCNGCHGIFINPLGFAFENYDNLGRYRATDAGMPVDASASYGFAEGELTFNGAVDLMRLVSEGEQSHSCYASQLFAYTYGRDPSETPADDALIAEIARRSRGEESIKSLVLALVGTEAFLSRLP